MTSLLDSSKGSGEDNISKEQEAEEVSEADTDELLLSGIELLSSITSIGTTTEQELANRNTESLLLSSCLITRTTTTSSRDANEISVDESLQEQRDLSSGVLSPESEQFPSGASASCLSKTTRTSFAARKLNFDQQSSASSPRKVQSISSPGGSAAEGLGTKSCLRKPDSPQKAPHLCVSFSEISTPRGSMQTGARTTAVQDDGADSGTLHRSNHFKPAIPLPLIPDATVDGFVVKLDTIFDQVREEFGRYSRMSNLSQTDTGSGESEQQRGAGVSYALNSEEQRHNQRKAYADSFLSGLNSEDLRHLLETENLKRIHCERTVHLLQRKLLALEERLTVSETLADSQRKGLDNIETEVRHLTKEFSERETQRIQMCERILAENLNLQDNLTLARSYAQTSAKRSEDLETKVGSQEKSLSEVHGQLQLLRHQNDSLRDQLQRLQSDNAALVANMDKWESAKTEWIQKEEEMTRELLDLEKLIKEGAKETQRLQTEVNAEKMARKLCLEQKDRECKMKLDDVKIELQKKCEETALRLEAEKQLHVRELKLELEELKRSTTEKLKRMQTERDEAQRKLADHERHLFAKQQQMCADIQQKLTEKYRELVLEFSAGHPAPSGVPTQPASFNPDCYGVRSYFEPKSNGANYDVGTHLPYPYHQGQQLQSSSAFGAPRPAMSAFPDYQGQLAGAEPFETDPPSLAEEFLMQMQRARPIGTPRDYDGSEQVSPLYGGGSGNSGPPSARKHQLQQYLKQVLTGKQTSSSSIPMSGPSVPLDPNSRR